MQLFDVAKGEQWPVCTKQRCRYDLHHFDTPPIGVPWAWDERRQRVLLLGYFCSLECALAWLLYHEKSYNRNRARRIGWLQRMARVVYGRTERVHPAPSPQDLVNESSIEEMRARIQTPGSAATEVRPEEVFVLYDAYQSAPKPPRKRARRDAATIRREAEEQRNRYITNLTKQPPPRRPRVVVPSKVGLNSEAGTSRSIVNMLGIRRRE
jgi:hypothetical protein